MGNVEEHYLHVDLVEHGDRKFKIRSPDGVRCIWFKTDKPLCAYLDNCTGAINAGEPIYVASGTHEGHA